MFLFVPFQRGAGSIEGASGFIAKDAHRIVVRLATGEDQGIHCPVVVFQGLGVTQTQQLFLLAQHDEFGTGNHLLRQSAGWLVGISR